MLLYAGIGSVFFGAFDDWYYWGILPARWVAPIGLLFGTLALVDTIRRLGGPAASLKALGGWSVRQGRWLLLGLGVVAVLGVVVTWEAYAAPQAVLVEGLPDAPVHVQVRGEESFVHVIEPGAQLEPRHA